MTETTTEPIAGSSWAAIDMAAVVDGILSGTTVRPTPTIGLIADAGALFYAGATNGIAGPSNAGKSLVIKCVTVQEIRAGRNVVMIDLEDAPESVAAMLMDLGATPEQVTRHVHYVRPFESLNAPGRENLAALLRETRPSLVVIDSTGEALALDGAKPNDDDDVARWFRRLPTAIANTGACVVLVDHVTKVDDSGLWPIGSQRKRAAISGAQYMLKTAIPFAKGQPGHAALICAKDRHGTYRQNQRVAEIHVSTDTEGRIQATLTAPQNASGDSSGFRPTTLMERASKALEGAQRPLSLREFRDLVGGKRESVDRAIEVLAAEGYVTRTKGTRNATLHAVSKPYRQADDPKSDAFADRGTVDAENGAQSVLTVPVPKEGARGHGHSPSPGHAGGTVGHGASEWAS